jgi:hypothetical protein
MKKISATIFLALLMLGATQVRADCSRIKFARGRTTAVLSGRIGPKKVMCYTLHAREGQHMTAHLTSPDKLARFSIVPDGYDADFLERGKDVTDWDGELGSASGAGDFIIFIEAPRAGSTFTFEITIR